MHIKIRIFPKDELLFGIRFGISTLVTDLSSYSPDKTYPKAYNLDIGFLFGNIQLLFKGSH